MRDANCFNGLPKKRPTGNKKNLYSKRSLSSFYAFQRLCNLLLEFYLQSLNSSSHKFGQSSRQTGLAGKFENLIFFRAWTWSTWASRRQSQNTGTRSCQSRFRSSLKQKQNFLSEVPLVLTVMEPESVHVQPKLFSGAGSVISHFGFTAPEP